MHLCGHYFCRSNDRTRWTCVICKPKKSCEAVGWNIIRHYLSEKHRKNVSAHLKASDAVKVGVGVENMKRMYRENIAQSIIDNAIVATSRKSLPFTSVPVMLNLTVGALNAMAGEELDKINIAEIKKVSKPAARVLCVAPQGCDQAEKHQRWVEKHLSTRQDVHCK